MASRILVRSRAGLDQGQGFGIGLGMWGLRFNFNGLFAASADFLVFESYPKPSIQNPSTMDPFA